MVAEWEMVNIPINNWEMSMQKVRGLELIASCCKECNADEKQKYIANSNKTGIKN